MMTTLLDRWAALRGESVSNPMPGYSLALKSTGHDVRAYVAILRPQCAPAILIEVPREARLKTLSSFRTRAFEVSVGSFPGLPADRTGLALHLTDAEFLDLFALLCDEMLASVEAAVTANGAVLAADRCLSRWRRFVERGRGSLSPEEVRGLMGELVVLARLASKRTPAEAMDGWAAPGGSVRDFELPDISIEVKTYQSAGGATLWINDPAQLDEGAGRPLFLVALRLSAGERGVTLPGLASSVRALLESDSATAERFDCALAACGYMAVQRDSYAERFMLGPLTMHKVVEGFPRIRPVDIPRGVEHVRFAIPIGALKRFVGDPEHILGPPDPTLEVTA